MVKMPPIKMQLIIFLSALAGYSSVVSRDPYFLFSLSLAAVSAVVSESALLYLRDKKITLTTSSVISGLIVGFVLSPGNPWWAIALASLLAILSKYLIRIKKRHIFNPAGFGIFAAMIILAAQSEWRETYLWPALIPCGVYFAYRVRKFALLAGYFLSSVILLVSQSLIQHSGFSHIPGIFSYFLIFIMLIEPKTTPAKAASQAAFGVIAAAAIFIFNNIGVRFDAELAGLLLANVFVPLLNIRKEKI